MGETATVTCAIASGGVPSTVKLWTITVPPHFWIIDAVSFGWFVTSSARVCISVLIDPVDLGTYASVHTRKVNVRTTIPPRYNSNLFPSSLTNNRSSRISLTRIFSITSSTKHVGCNFTCIITSTRSIIIHVHFHRDISSRPPGSRGAISKHSKIFTIHKIICVSKHNRVVLCTVPSQLHDHVIIIIRVRIVVWMLNEIYDRDTLYQIKVFWIGNWIISPKLVCSNQGHI
mmetsp:Transcript_4637/g.6863  ORF Transcript_4637/g.6863 Transcript_4637/m.6863 type:complete len:230 (-) Transcript_4637:415-1104(-)